MPLIFAVWCCERIVGALRFLRRVVSRGSSNVFFFGFVVPDWGVCNFLTHLCANFRISLSASSVMCSNDIAHLNTRQGSAFQMSVFTFLQYLGPGDAVFAEFAYGPPPPMRILTFMDFVVGLSMLSPPPAPE